MEFHGLFTVLALLLFVGLSNGEVVAVQKCYVPRGRPVTCTIHEVQITPCPEAAQNKPCKLKLGTNATITFEYTPTWSATKVGSQAFKVGSAMDIGFEHMDTNGCKYTTCPIEADKKQSYTFSLSLDTQFPAGIHQTKWKLWSEDDYHQQCCFKLPLQLVN